MGRHNTKSLKILKKDIIMSTNEVMEALEKSLTVNKKKWINWHSLYRVLMELTDEGKIERFKAKAGFFWRRK